MVVKVNEPLLRGYLEALNTISEDFGLINDATAMSVSRFPDVLTAEKKELDAEAAQACANLSAYGVVREGRLIGDEMTRAEAAMLLASAINIIDNN